MLRFLGKIRKNLLGEGRISRYIFYAIGEIFLVVIGILIALSINNWNTKLQEKKELNGYLQNISNNIKGDKEQIKYIISFRDSVIVYSEKIIDLGKKERIDLDEFLLITHDDYNAFYDNYVEINQSGFDALKSSGYLGKIQNTAIEKLLNDYYVLVNYISKQEQSLNNFIENMEVDGFETNVFPRIISILERPDAGSYFRNNQDEIKELITSPSIFGANFRATIITELMDSYDNLLTLGEEIIKEIKAMVKE